MATADRPYMMFQCGSQCVERACFVDGLRLSNSKVDSIWFTLPMTYATVSPTSIYLPAPLNPTSPVTLSQPNPFPPLTSPLTRPFQLINLPQPPRHPPNLSYPTHPNFHSPRGILPPGSYTSTPPFGCKPAAGETILYSPTVYYIAIRHF